MKNERELVKKNLELSFEFSRYLLSRPELEAKIPENALIVFNVADDPTLTRFNKTLAKRNAERGQPIITVWVKGLAPTRLLEPRVISATG